MDPVRIAELLQPFIALDPGAAADAPLLNQVSVYLDLLLRWNARMNLTAVREPDAIITRHFGESFFAGKHVLLREAATPPIHLIDIGSGAGFPGLPIKLLSPTIRTTLIESNQKKVTFLREVVRALELADVDVIQARAEDAAMPSPSGRNLVTLRAVERFDTILPTAIKMMASTGIIALLIGQSQYETLPYSGIEWSAPIPIPDSQSRILLVGQRAYSPISVMPEN
jgi:16S rRNA (guanine527-N7)-methyltransferase